jgi:hypothetical protein
MQRVQRQVHHSFMIRSLASRVNLREQSLCKRYFSSPSVQSDEGMQPNDVNACIIPSLSESDNGSFAFRNSNWRKNKNWKMQFASTYFLPHASISRGLFGNVLLDVSDCHGPVLNKIVYNMNGTQQYMMNDMKT